MPKSPESEILAKFFADMGENHGENLAKKIADSRPSISRNIGRKNFDEKSSANSTSHATALLRKRPVLLRANFVLTKDRKRPYYGLFCGKIHREGSCSKAAGGP